VSQKYCVLLGEVADDPAVLDPTELLARLQAALTALNREQAESIATPLTLSGGFPEFTGVLYTHSPIYEIARTVSDACHPLPTRIALGRGEISSGLDRLDPEAMDGPAYDLTGELLYRARKEERLLIVDTGDPRFDTLLNALMLLIQRHFEQWTSRQWEVASLYRELGRQSEVAERLQVSQQSVSSTLAGAGWKTVAEVEGALRNVLSDPVHELLGRS
jgi:hypothetical protein